MSARADAWTLAALLGVAPLLPWGPRYAGLDPGYAMDAVALAMVGVWLISRVLAGRRGRHHHGDSRLVYTWAVFMAVVSGAALVGLAANNRFDSPVFRRYLPEFVAHMLGPTDLTWDPLFPARIWLTHLEGFVVFVAMLDCGVRAPDRRRFWTTLAWGSLAGVAIVATFAIVQYVTRFELHPEWVRANPNMVRAHATLDDPNMLGSYLLLGIGTSIGVALAEARRVRARAAAAVGVLAVLALVTTGSRTAWTAAVLTAVVLLGFGPTVPRLQSLSRIRAAARWGLAGLIGLACLLGAARFVVRERPLAPARPASAMQAVVETLDPRVPLREVFKDRPGYWGAAVRMGLAHPLAGVGLGRFARALPDYRRIWLAPENTHNLFLQLLAEAGVAGFITFAALLATALSSLARHAPAGDAEHAGIAWGALFGTGAFAVTLLASHPLLLPSGQILFASSLAVWAIGCRDEAASPLARRRARYGAVLLGGSVFAGFLMAAARVPSPPRADDWGYSWGLFSQEGDFFPTALGVQDDEEDPGVPAPANTEWQRFRWSGTHAILDLRAPASARECVLAFTAPLPAYGQSQYVWIWYGDTPSTTRISTRGLNEIRIALSPDVLDPERRLIVHLRVGPAFVPAEFGPSPDHRQLGVLLFRPRFV